MTLRRDIRLVLSDVDGTLVDPEKKLTQPTIEAAKALHAAGIGLAVTSSRPPLGLRMLIEPLALKGVLAGFNGGLIVNTDFSRVEHHPLDPAAAKQALELILAHGLDAWVFTDDVWLIRNKDGPRVALETRTVQFGPEIVNAFTDAHLANAFKIVGVSDDFDRVAACEKESQAILGDRASATRSQSYYLDVTHPLANKGTVVTILAERLNISPAQIATIGDGRNDVLMFRKSGFSIAMGNASDEVKAQTQAVTLSNAQDGFAAAMHKFILGAGT